MIYKSIKCSFIGLDTKINEYVNQGYELVQLLIDPTSSDEKYFVLFRKNKFV